MNLVRRENSLIVQVEEKEMFLNWKFSLKIFISFLLLFLYCEYVIYFFIINNCVWPKIDVEKDAKTVGETIDNAVKIMVIADTHLLGPRKGHWFDKLRREWQMYRSFQTAITLLKPELIFILGDIMDEGFYSSPEEFDKYVQRFHKIFSVPDHLKLYTVVGNHDIGFHYETTPYRNRKFADAFNAPPVQLITVRGNHFVLVNSMALEGDGCFLCKPAEQLLSKIEKILKCSNNSYKGHCDPEHKLEVPSRPILMQHYPLFRLSDMDCDDDDSAPLPIKKQRFREKWDCLSREATYQILNQIRPRLSLSGHTHHGCTRKLPVGEGIEITIPSFSWRNKNNPTIGLGVFTPDNYSFTKCAIPQESTVISLYTMGIAFMIFWTLYSFMKNRRRIHYKYK